MRGYIKQFGWSHYTQRRRLRSHPEFAVEEQFMDENMPRWIADGKDGWFVAIRGREVVGMWSNWAEADSWRRAVREPVYLQQIKEWTKLLVGIAPYATPEPDVQGG
jgi:hypothetical protein